MHHQFNIQQLHALPALYLCVLYLSENKQRLVPLTTHFVEKNNIKFAQHFPIMYVNIAAILITVLGKNNRRYYFLSTFRQSAPSVHYTCNGFTLYCTSALWHAWMRIVSDTRYCINQNIKIYISIYIFFFCCGAATQSGPWPPHSWGFLDHTQRRTTFGRTPLDEWSARRRDLYLTTHNIHNRQTSMPPVEFEPTISAG